MTLHLATTTELLDRARKVRKQVFTIEKQIPELIEVDELDCLNEVCDHFFVEFTEQVANVEKGKNVGEGEEVADICALRCKHLDNNRIQLQRFCVLKDYRAAGVGRWTLEQIEEYYWNKNIDCITLDAKFHVREFYEKCGYVVVSEPFMEAGIEHVVMEKRRNQG